MLTIGLALKGYAIEATDGTIGTIADFLFHDKTWAVRWMVVETGFWLTGRKVLIHPAAIGRADHARRTLPVALSMAQIKAGPDIATDEPVSRRMEHSLYGYFGWDPFWGGAFAMADVVGSNTGALDDLATDDGDPDLRSFTAVAGYHIEASDGPIGHLENFLVDDLNWAIRYLLIDTKNWWAGQHVLISPRAVTAISWLDHSVQLDIARDKVRGSPPMGEAHAESAQYHGLVDAYYNWH